MSNVKNAWGRTPVEQEAFERVLLYLVKASPAEVDWLADVLGVDGGSAPMPARWCIGSLDAMVSEPMQLVPRAQHEAEVAQARREERERCAKVAANRWQMRVADEIRALGGEGE